MDEYKFEYEKDPALKKAATDAVNRTLWFQHWIRHKTLFRNQILNTAGILIAWGLAKVIPFPNDNVTIIMAPLAWLSALMPFAVLFAALVTTTKGSDKWWFLKKQETIRRSASFWRVWAFLCFSALLIYLTTHLFAPYLALILFVVGWDWHELHKLRKNLVTWGILEADGSPRSHECEPSAPQLEISDQRLDNVLRPQGLHRRLDQTTKQKTTV